MTDKFYVPVQGENGDVTYVEADEKTLNAFVNNHPKHKEVLTEAIKRKEKIKALTAGLADDSGDTEAPSPKPNTPQQPAPLDLERLTESITEGVLNKLVSKQAEAENRRNTITQLIKANGLSEDDRAFLEGSLDPEKAAQFLARRVKQFAPTSVAPVRDALPQTEKEVEDFRKRVAEKMKNRK